MSMQFKGNGARLGRIGFIRRGANRPQQGGSRYKLLAAVVVMAVAFAGIFALAADDSRAFDGSGSEGDPYILYSAADLAKLNEGLGTAGQNVWFVLGNNIAVSGAWTPVGTSADPFQGHLDGKGYTITLNAVVQSQYTGMFGCISNAEIKNLRIMLNNNISPIVISAPAEIYIGGLAGRINSSVIYNVVTEGGSVNFSMSGNHRIEAGGLAGYVENSTITYAYSNIDVWVDGNSSGADACAGGLIAHGVNNTIDSSFAENSVQIRVGQEQVNAGGFIGYTTGGSITRCSSIGNVNAYNAINSAGTYGCVGGFVGRSNTPISYSYSQGNVDYEVNNRNAQGGYIGGFAGMNENSISNVYSTGDVSTNLMAGNGGRNQGYLTGATGPGGSVTDSYYDRDDTVSPAANNTGGQGTGLSDPQMKDEDNFSSGWKDGDWVWNGDYPTLSSFTFIIEVIITPSSSYGTIRYARDYPATITSAQYTGPITGNIWSKYNFLAAANTNRVFLYWEGGDDEDVFALNTSVTAPIPVSMGSIENRTVTAHFESVENAVLLSINSIPTGSGIFTYEVGGIPGIHSYTSPRYFAKGTSVTVTAAPAGTRTFSFWAVNESWNTSSVTGPIELQESMMLNAVFVQASDPILTLAESPSGAGSFTYEIQAPAGSWMGPIDYGSPVQIPSGYSIRATAIADYDAGYIFVPGTGWSGPGTTDGGRRLVTAMASNTTITATFTRGAIVSAEAVPGAGGTFMFSTDGLIYAPRAGGRVTVPIGTSVWITANAEPGYTFSHWVGQTMGDDVIYLSPTEDISLSAYFYRTSEAYDVKTTVVGEGRLHVTVEGVTGPVLTTGTRTIKVSAGDDVVIEAEDSAGEFMFYIGTVNTGDRVIQINDIDRDHTETAYFSFGSPTSLLTFNIVGSGYLMIQIYGWQEAIDTRAFSNGEIPPVRITTGTTGDFMAYGDGGMFQNYTVADATGMTYFFEPLLGNRMIVRDTEITVYFTETMDVYTLGLSATTGNSITYSIDGASPVVYTSSGIYDLCVENGLDTEIGYIEGAGLFQHFVVDRENSGISFSLPGPTEVFADHQSHTIRAIFTDPDAGGIFEIYELTVRVHGIGAVALIVGTDPPETITANGSTVTRTITPDYYKRVNISYTSGKLQYSTWTLVGGTPSYDFGNGILIDQPLEIGGEYVVDVYFLNGPQGYELELVVVGSGKIVFDIGTGPVSLTSTVRTVTLPLLSTDIATVNGEEEAGGGKLQGYTHRYASTTDVILFGPLVATSALGNQTITAFFTDSASSQTISMGTYGSGFVTFTLDGIMGRYKSPAAGEMFHFPIDINDSVQMGHMADGGRFQFYTIDGVLQFQSQTLTGAANHTVIAYFTDTTSTYNLTIGVAGSGTVIAEIFDGSSPPAYTSVILEHGNASQDRTIPLDMDDTASVRAKEVFGHFQYFSVGTNPPVAVQGTAITSDTFGYPDTVSSAAVIVALFTDNKANDYQLVLNVGPDEKGALTYQIGEDPAVSYRSSSPRIIWIDPYENTTIGYDDTGGSDGYFQYFIYEKNGGGMESIFTIPLIVGKSGDVHVITAKFTDDQTNVKRHSLATIGNGYVTFKVGTDPVGKFNSLLYHGIDGEPMILFVNDTNAVQTEVHMEEFDPMDPLYKGYQVDQGTIETDPMLAPIYFACDTDHEIIIFFDFSAFTYYLEVTVHGGGTVDIDDVLPQTRVTHTVMPDVLLYKNLRITAEEDGGFFQIIRVTKDGGATYEWYGSPYTIWSGTVAPNAIVMVDVYFTVSDAVYYLSVQAEAGGTITYDIDGTGVRKVSYQDLDIPVDIGSTVQIGREEDEAGRFQYYVYDDESVYEFRPDDFDIESNTVRQDTNVNVAALFTTTKSTYDVTLASVGDGFVTFTESSQGRQTQAFQGGPYTMPFDVGTSVSVGWAESSAVVRFQYLEYTDDLSNVTTQRTNVAVSGASGSTYAVTAYFSEGAQYVLSLSTNLSSQMAIGAEIDGGSTIWHIGTLAVNIPVNMNSTVYVTERVDAPAVNFEFFVMNNAAVFKSGLEIPGDAAPVQNSTISVLAYFSNNASSYTVNLSTVGSGSITYSIGTYQTGSFRSVSSPGLEELEFRLNNSTAFTFSNSPDPDAMFTYYIYTLDGGSPMIRTQAQPTPPMSLLGSSQASPYHEIVAAFTGTDHYTLALSASGGGLIEYTVGTDPMATYAGDSALNLHIDKGTDVTVNYRETRPDSFQWFVQTIGTAAPFVTRSSPVIPHEDQSIQALFIGGDVYYVTLKTDGGGQAVLTAGGYTFVYRGTVWTDPGERIPISAGMSASIGYREDPGQHFQQYDHEVNGTTVSLSTGFTVIGTPNEEHIAIAYFTSGTNHYVIDLSKVGTGNVTFKIRNQGIVSVSNSVSSPYRLYLGETDWVEVGNAPGISAFQYYNYAGSLYDDGPLLDPLLLFPAYTTGMHSATAVFTNASAASAYTVTLNTVGEGYITFRLSTMDAGKYAKFQSAGTPYVLRVDSGQNVTVGYEESDGYFVGFKRDTQVMLVTNPTISVNSSTAITAYFTKDKTNVFSADVSTFGNGYILYTYRDLGVSGQYRSTAGSEHRVFVDIGDELTIGHSNNAGEYFNAFIEDGITVLGAEEITYSPAVTGHHAVTAVFTNTSAVYEVVLATVGSGSILFEIQGSISGKYSGNGRSVYVDRTNALTINNEPDSSFFQYYGLSVQGNETFEIVPIIVVPAGSTGTRTVIAHFTFDDVNVYTLELSTVGEGYIVFYSKTGAAGQFKSSSLQEKLVLYIDNTEGELRFGAVNGSGTFRFMVYDSIRTIVTLPVIINENDSSAHTLVAYFTNSSAMNVYLSVGRTGTGQVDVDITTEGVTIPTIKDFIGIIPMLPMDGTDSVTLTAVETIPEYKFTRWVSTDVPNVNGSTEAAVTFSMNANANITAYFSAADDVHTLILTAGPGGKVSFIYGVGTALVTGTVEEGTKTFSVLAGRAITLTADPLNPSTTAFTHWTSDSVPDINNVANRTVFVIDTDADAAAHFTAADNLYTFMLTAERGGEASFTYGSGTSAVTGRVADGTEAFSIPRGEEMALTPNEVETDYAFTKWTSDSVPDIDGIADRTAVFTMSANSDATAEFSETDTLYTFELTAETGGKAAFTYGTGASAATGRVVEGTGTFNIPKNQKVTLTAEPLDVTSAFTGWTSGTVDEIEGTANSMAEFIISTDSDATALFSDAGDVWKLSLSATVGGSVSFTYGGSTQGQVAANDSQDFFIPKGSLLDIVAAPSGPEYMFSQWTLDAAGKPAAFSMTLSSDFDASAEFVLSRPPGTSYTITASSDEGSYISPSGTVSVQAGSNRTFTFSAETGYEITAVYVDRAPLSSEAVASGEYTFFGVQRDHTISVVSAPSEMIMLFVEIEGGEGAAVYHIGPTTYYNHIERTLQVEIHSDLYVSVEIKDGYKFVNWTGDVNSKDVELHYADADHDIHLVAHLRSDGGGDGEWAVVNIILAVLAVFTGAIAIMTGRGRQNEEGKGLSKATFLRTAALILAVISLAFSFIVEDPSLSIGTVNKWTPLMGGLFAAVLILIVLSFRSSRD